MKRIIQKIGFLKFLLLPIFICSLAVYAMTLYFQQHDVKAPAKAGEKFDSQLKLGMIETVIFPGDTFYVSPTVTNLGTEEMYVFVRITMPTTADNRNLYEFEAGSDWTIVESSNGVIVFAFADSDSSMHVLAPEESTTPITTQMTMRAIGYAEYAGYEDIAFTASSLVVGIDDISINPSEAWIQCKRLGNIE